MIINRMICKAGLANNPNKPLKSISWICLHCTGNYASTATAKNHAVYLNNGSGGTQASFHYAVDKDDIYQMFEDTQGCWHCGNTTGNDTSIGIEVCVNDRAGFRQACLNAAWLVAELLKRHKLTIDKVVQHYNFSGKDCPAELRSGAWGITWMQFIDMVKSNMGAESSPSATKYYRIQVGAFSVKSNADAILIKIKAAGFADAFVTPLGADKLYRVQIGAYSVKANADAMLARVKAAGFSDAFVRYGD